MTPSVATDRILLWQFPDGKRLGLDQVGCRSTEDTEDQSTERSKWDLIFFSSDPLIHRSDRYVYSQIHGRRSKHRVRGWNMAFSLGREPDPDPQSEIEKVMFFHPHCLGRAPYRI